MSDVAPCILWLRRDLRLDDHPALIAAAEGGRPVIPVFIRDASVDALGAAPAWRLGKGLEALATALDARNMRLILRAGPALEVLEELCAETGATAVHWTRLYDREARERDARIKSTLTDRGLEARSFGGHLMFEPWTVETGQGGFYKVFTPYWRNVKSRDVPAPRPAPDTLTGPARWPVSDTLADWTLGAAMDRGAEIVAAHVSAGEAAAQMRLRAFVAGPVAEYPTARDVMARDGTSGMSQYLSLGEISAHQCWHAAQEAEEAGRGDGTFRKELAWREFAYHLLYHTPHLPEDNWRPSWNGFPWTEDTTRPEIVAWMQGRTGIELVDAAMREMYVTGTMHNRARMIAASYLTKHLLGHWRIGLAWFEDCLVDWDIANNALGWQWVAGSGPDASPFFRIFNPDTQARKFDRDGAYRRRWIAEGADRPEPDALAYFRAVPVSWALSPDDAYPAPVVALDDGRSRALEAYRARED